MNSSNPEKHNYPDCDPSWCYAEQYILANQAKEQIEEFIKKTSQHEEWSRGTDHYLEGVLDHTEQILSRIVLDP